MNFFDNKMIIKKHSALVQTNAKDLTLIQRKALNYFIYILQKQGCKDFYEIPLQEIKEIICDSKTQNKYIKEQLKKLPEVTIEYNCLNKDKQIEWGIICIIPSVRINFGTGMVKFEISNAFKEVIMKPYMYVPLNIIMLTFLKCKYSLVLYEFLRDYLTAERVPLLTIEELKKLLGIDVMGYRKFKDFKRDVLDKTVNEINEITDIDCSYELKNVVGRRYTHIQFSVTKNDNYNQKFIEYETKSEQNNEYKEKEIFLESPKEEAQIEISKIEIPEEIKEILKLEHRTTNVYKIIECYLDKGINFVISNIKYIYNLPNPPHIFSAYLKTTFENDYGKEIREIEANKKKVRDAKKAELEKEREKERAAEREALKMETALNSLSAEERTKLEALAIDSIRKTYPILEGKPIPKPFISAKIYEFIKETENEKVNNKV